MHNTKRRETLPVMERLLEISEEVSEELLNAALGAAPEHLRNIAESEVRPISRSLVPVTLECIARGGAPDEAHLEQIRQSARRNLRSQMPASVALNMIRASTAAFTCIVMRHATPADAASVLTLMGRAAVLTHLYSGAYISGVEHSPRCLPEWWSNEPLVAKRALELLSKGYSTREIAVALRYSESAISYHLGNLMRRSGCSNRTELVSRAHEAGVLGTADDAGRPPFESVSFKSV